MLPPSIKWTKNRKIDQASSLLSRPRYRIKLEAPVVGFGPAMAGSGSIVIESGPVVTVEGSAASTLLPAAIVRAGSTSTKWKERWKSEGDEERKR